jgi:NAD(P)-dependent dehydrogenase (short-subunit alcohol dehydrogenase family)
MPSLTSSQSSGPILVTGSSTGLGLETALHLADRGFKVYATIRDLSKESAVRQIATERGVTLEVLQLDVTDPQSIDQAVNQIMETDGRIYGLVNNAGIALRGCLEDLDDDEIRAVFEANVFGTFAVSKRVLPHMREAGDGRIINISSVGGRISSFGLSMYCSTKFAIEGFGEALYLETAPFGVKAILIEPGIINTSRWSHNRGNARRAHDTSSPYSRLFQKAEALADQRVEMSRTKPEDVARTIFRALTDENPRLRYVVGRPAGAAILARRYLPERLFDRLYFGSLLKQLTKQDMAEPAEPVEAATQ